MMQFGRKFLVVIFFIILLLPIFQMKFGLFKNFQLVGTEMNIERLPWNWKSWVTGERQENLDAWFKKNFGFRGLLVKTVNQINFSLFKELNQNSNVRLVLGKENWLFEKGYLDNFNNKDFVNNDFLIKKIELLSLLQDKLLEKGIRFLLVISPSKASIYPEYLPEDLVIKNRNGEQSNYNRLIKILENSKINYFDTTDYLLRLKNEKPFTLFTKGGTHWNYYSACLVSSEIITRIEKIANKNMINIVCDPPTIDYDPQGKDMDLADLTNIWNEDVFKGETVHPFYNNNKDGSELLPKILLVGDSFSWQILETMGSQKVYNILDFLYYNKTLHHYTKEKAEPTVTEGKWDWSEVLLAKDVVILEINESGLAYSDFGFPEEVIHYLNE